MIEILKFDLAHFKMEHTKKLVTSNIWVKVSAEERREIKAMAKLCDMTMTNYIRVLHHCVRNAYLVENEKGDK